MFKIKPVISILAFFIIFSTSNVSAAFIYNESNNGDLSSTDIGTLSTFSTFIGSLDGGDTAGPMDGPDEEDRIKFTVDIEDTVITVELVSLSLQGADIILEDLKLELRQVPDPDEVITPGLPNTVIIRQAAEVVYANIIPGQYEIELSPADNIGNFDYLFTIRTRATVPEPSSLFLIGISLLGLFRWSKKL